MDLIKIIQIFCILERFNSSYKCLFSQVKLNDGTINTVFKSFTSLQTPAIFHSCMITPVLNKRKKMSIHAFMANGICVYTDKID